MWDFWEKLKGIFGVLLEGFLQIFLKENLENLFYFWNFIDIREINARHFENKKKKQILAKNTKWATE